jgi:hypothetical protein
MPTRERDAPDADAANAPPRQPSVGPIEIRAEAIARLFHTLDPSPFRERDLDLQAEDFIIGWARELPRAAPIRIVIHLPSSELQNPLAAQLPEVIARNFDYRAKSAELELKELFRIGRISLLIGLAVLAACVVTLQALFTRLGSGLLARFFGEGLIILGWVANWRPIEIFLYDWWPLVRRRNLFRRLAAADVELRASDRS